MKTILLGLLLTVSTLSQAQVVFEVTSFIQQEGDKVGEWQDAGGAIVLEENAWIFHFEKTIKFIIVSKQESKVTNTGNEIWHYEVVDSNGIRRFISVVMDKDANTYITINYHEHELVFMYRVNINE